MKPSALLINAARGRIVDTIALARHSSAGICSARRWTFSRKSRPPWIILC